MGPLLGRWYFLLVAVSAICLAVPTAAAAQDANDGGWVGTITTEIQHDWNGGVWSGNTELLTVADAPVTATSVPVQEPWDASSLGIFWNGVQGRGVLDSIAVAVRGLVAAAARVVKAGPTSAPFAAIDHRQ